MSIGSEIQRLQMAKADIKSAIEAKGVTVGSGDTLDDYAALIGSISSGGDVDKLIGLTERTLTSFDIPVGTESLGSYAFYNFSSLLSITIPEGVKNMGEGCLRGCSGLTTLELPSSVERIGNFAFYSGVKIGTIISRRSTAPTIGSAVFGNTAGSYVGKDAVGPKMLYVPYGCSQAYQTGNWLGDLLNSGKCGFSIAELDENGNIPE